MKVKAVIFVHNYFEWKSFFSALLVWPLIRWATRSNWNHCALLVELGGQEWIVEALGKGVTMTARETWEVRAKRQTEFVEVVCYPLWLRNSVGKPYDYPSLLWWKGIKILSGNWYGPTWEKAQKAVFCSELAAMVVECPHPWDMSPQDLYRLLHSEEGIKNNIKRTVAYR